MQWNIPRIQQPSITITQNAKRKNGLPEYLFTIFNNFFCHSAFAVRTKLTKKTTSWMRDFTSFFWYAEKASSISWKSKCGITWMYRIRKIRIEY